MSGSRFISSVKLASVSAPPISTTASPAPSARPPSSLSSMGSSPAPADASPGRLAEERELMLEAATRVQAHQREMADATVQEVLNLVGTVQAAEPPAGWKAVKLRSTTR